MDGEKVDREERGVYVPDGDHGIGLWFMVVYINILEVSLLQWTGSPYLLRSNVTSVNPLSRSQRVC